MVRSLDNIKWFDNVLNQPSLSELHKFCMEQNKWAIQISTSLSNKSSNTNFFWKLNLDQTDSMVQGLFGQVKKIIGENYIIAAGGCYVNGQSTLQDGNLHNDDVWSENYHPYTFLVYINPEWRVTWGGCTVFINKYMDSFGRTSFFDNETSIKSIRFLPKPNCGLLFPGEYMHYAESPSKNYNGLRMTLAFKLQKID